LTHNLKENTDSDLKEIQEICSKHFSPAENQETDALCCPPAEYQIELLLMEPQSGCSPKQSDYRSESKTSIKEQIEIKRHFATAKYLK
jgi:hypothetical protein